MSTTTLPVDTDIHITTIFDDPRDFLTEDQKEISKNLDFQCPEIHLRIENIKLKALIDTGSKISGISEYSFNKHKSQFKKCEKLPLPNLTAVGFTGEKSNKLKIQIFPIVQIDSLCIKLNFIVVPKLIKECILGIDALTILNAQIDIKNNFLTLNYNNKIEKINFNYKNYITADKETLNNLYSCIQFAQSEIDIEGEGKSSQDIPSYEDIAARVAISHNLTQHER